MKTYKFRTVAAALVVAFVAGIFAMRAGTIIIGSMATWTSGTNYSATVSLGTVPMAGRTISIQTGGLVATNNLSLYAQISLGVDTTGATNYVTIAGPWYPSATNAGSYSWIIPATNITMYGRVFGIQTNTVSIGGSIQ